MQRSPGESQHGGVNLITEYRQVITPFINAQGGEI